MIITNSPDINLLQVQVTWDISGNTPLISLLNLSTGNNLSNITWAFVATSPSGTYIHNGNIAQPDITGSWSTYSLMDAWPRPFNQIEWSGAPYQFYVIAKDSIGNIYQTPAQLASICRPAGNFPNSKTPFGLAESDVKVMCQEARVFFQDTTYHSYKGLDGIQVSSSLRVIYPIDETATIPDPFQITAYSTALVPISYSSNNYQFLQTTIYDYDLSGYVHVRIRYQNIRTFAVWCNVDLYPLTCEINKLAYSIETGNCADVQEAQSKMNRIIPKLINIGFGIQQPLLGIDVPELIEQIKFIGGFDCNCCGAITGIIPTTASIIDGYTFSVNKLGGDVNGNFSTSGPNIQLNIADVSYIVTVGQGSPSTISAFGFTSSTAGDGYTKTYYLTIDGHQLALDILNNIASNPDALNLFNSLVAVGSSNFKLIVDGGCIFSSTASCDYDFTLAGIPANTTYALITSIKAGNISNPLSYSFNLTNLPGLQGYLNALGIGIFVVSDLGGGNVLISSLTNTNELISLTYKVGGTNLIADFSRNCTGYIPKSANEVVQAIIDYLCGLTDAQVVTSQDYVVCYIDPVLKSQQTQTVNGGTELTSFINTLLLRGCDTINYVMSLGALNCSRVQSLFPQSSALMQATDWLDGIKAGQCARIFPVEFGTRLFQLGTYDPNFMAAFCAAVALCNQNQICTPYTTFSVSVEQFNSDCPAILDFVYNFSAQELNITKLIFANIPSSSQTVTILYKLQSSGSYTTYSNSIIVNTDGTLIVPTSILLLSGQIYDIQILDNCQSPAEGIVKVITAPGTPAIQSQYQFGIDSGTVCDAIPETLYSASIFNHGVQMFTDISLNTPLTTFTFIVNPSNNHIYAIDPTTGVIGFDTGDICGTFITGSYRYSTDALTLCATSPNDLYSSGILDTGTTMYTDTGLTIRLTGFNFIALASVGLIYNIDSTTGVVGSPTGNSC